MYCLYNKETGKIIQATNCKKEDIYLYEKINNCSSVLGNCDVINDYVKDGKITPRPEINVNLSKSTISANGVDVCVISGVPENTTLTNDGNSIVSDGQDIEYVTDIVGEHIIKLSLFPYKNKEIVINAI